MKTQTSRIKSSYSKTNSNTQCKKLKKSNFHYTRDTTPKRVTSGGDHLRDLACGQHSFEEASQRRRAVGDTVFDLIGQVTEPKTLTTKHMQCYES